MLQPQDVAEQARDARPKAIQPGQCILAHRDEKARIHVLTVDGAGKFTVERVARLRFRMVEEILLELVVPCIL